VSVSPSPNASLTPAPGHLYVVATPIGNLADVTERARALLGAVDLIACEDTRTTGVLLNRLGVKRPMVPYHEHNETTAAAGLVRELAGGKSIALVCDAGTPGLSDPGFRLTRACQKQGLPVVPVPGASAITAGLCAAGLPTNGFFYAGFLPPKSAARTRFLAKYHDFDYTIVLYESCHRIAKLSAELVAVLGPDRVVCIAKEITKRHETFLVGPAATVDQRLQSMSLKGEFVVLIAPPRFAL
jgi:16S rRNA (cytidine1402-2'-O)-methyltransferase